MTNLTNFNAAKLWMNRKLSNANNVESKPISTSKPAYDLFFYLNNDS